MSLNNEQMTKNISKSIYIIASWESHHEIYVAVSQSGHFLAYTTWAQLS